MTLEIKEDSKEKTSERTIEQGIENRKKGLDINWENNNQQTVHSCTRKI